jgi:osmotically inducible lipoprotein OsmB
MKKIIAILLIASLTGLTGCTTGEKQTAGIVGGGVVGGVVGNAVTGGSAVGTGIGAVGGALVGNELSK